MMRKFYVKRKIVQFIDLINIKRGKDKTDISGTIETIRNSVQIKGANIWILLCGSLVASIGLDTNSSTLLIGAMLISTLMVPNIGIGIFYAINDWDNFMHALKKFGVAILVGIGASFIYFLITPFGDPTPEILAREKPTLLDAMVALFGAIAGMIAFTRKEKTTAIPGVAVAITLMPPICVVGFGIANLNGELTFGAFYFFLINAIVIALTSSFIAKILGFPLKNELRKAPEIYTKTWIIMWST